MNVAFFASGEGTNAELTAKHLKSTDIANPKLLLSNRQKAGALSRAKAIGMNTAVFDRHDLENGKVLQILEQERIDTIILQGFLLMLPAEIVKAYRWQSVNQHPALLPKYGGSGMYGRAVHEAVAASGDKVSGFTLHRVNDRYDDGDILFQEEISITPGDADQIEAAVRKLENDLAPRVIGELIVTGKLDAVKQD